MESRESKQEGSGQKKTRGVCRPRFTRAAILGERVWQASRNAGASPSSSTDSLFASNETQQLGGG